MKPCIECGQLGDGPRCPVHQRQMEAGRLAKFPQRIAYRDPLYKAIRVEVQRGTYGPCVDCGTYENLTCDHHVPLSKGGSLGSHNIVVRCSFHNTSKGAKCL